MHNTYQRAIEDSQTRRTPPGLCHVERFEVVKKCAIEAAQGSKIQSAFGNWNVWRKCPVIMYGGKFHVQREYRVYSRGQSKSTNKNGNSLMAEKVTGKCADMLRKASGQISAKSHEPLWRKCPYKEIIPEILAGTPKSARKNMKNSAIASFHREQSAHQFSKQVIGGFSWKKMLNIDPNRRFDVTSR